MFRRPRARVERGAHGGALPSARRNLLDESLGASVVFAGHGGGARSEAFLDGDGVAFFDLGVSVAATLRVVDVGVSRGDARELKHPLGGFRREGGLVGLVRAAEDADAERGDDEDGA